MAYVSRELKKSLAPNIKRICAKYGVKATLAVRTHSTLVLNIKSGPIDFIGNCNLTCSKDYWQVAKGFRVIEQNYLDVNVYHYKTHFSGEALAFLSEVISAMYGPDYYDNSDPQSDYFDCSHYIDVNIGKWNTPYVLEKP